MFDLVLKIEADGMMSGHQSNQSPLAKRQLRSQFLFLLRLTAGPVSRKMRSDLRAASFIIVSMTDVPESIVY